MHPGMEPAHDKSLGWKVLGAFALVFAIAWLGGAAWGVAATLGGRALKLSDTAISTASLLGITLIRLVVWIPVTRLVLKRRLGEIAFPFRPGWWLDLLAGVLLTSLAILVVFLAAVQAGWLVVDGVVWSSLSAGAFVGKLWVSLLINASVAVVEEIIFRAYLLTGLKVAWGRTIALVVMAVVFSLLHAPALEGQSPLTLAAALLLLAGFGLVFGWVYLRTGSLWLPVGIHFAWDFVENDLLNLSGDMANPHVIGLVTRLQGPFPLAGLENALLLDVLALALLCLGLWLWLSRRWVGLTDAEMD